MSLTFHVKNGFDKITNDLVTTFEGYYVQPVVYMLWFKFFLGLKCSNKFNFCFSLPLVMVIAFRQRKVKIKLF